MSHEEKDITSDFIYRHGERIDGVIIKEGKVFFQIPILAKPKLVGSDIELVFLYATTDKGSQHVVGIKEGELYINDYVSYRIGMEDNIKAFKLYVVIWYSG